MNNGEVYKLNSAKITSKKRSVFPHSTPHLMSMNFGRLYPHSWRMVMPGDSITDAIKSVVRMQTPIAPIMGSSELRYHAFWVPFRLVLNQTKQFFGENDESAWTRRTSIELPKYKFSESFVFTSSSTDETALKSTGDDWIQVGSYSTGGTDYKIWVDAQMSYIYGANKLLDYLGYHPYFDPENAPAELFNNASNGTFGGATLKYVEVYDEFDALLIRAIWLIWNEYYRDENYQDPILFSKDAANVNDFQTLAYPFDFPYGRMSDSKYVPQYSSGMQFVPIINKKHDILVSMLPEPQRGPAVNILSAANGFSPVFAGTEHIASGDPAESISFRYRLGTGVAGGLADKKNLTTDGNGKSGYDGTANAATGFVTPTNLQADISRDTELTINALRLAALTQQFYETLGYFGERYNELIYGLFGVKVADATIDRPEYLGGVSFPIDTFQVPQTSAGGAGQTELGDLGAFGYGSDHSSIADKSFDEWGYFIVLASARVDHLYPTLAAPEIFYKDRLEFHYPIFDHMGMMPFLKKYKNPILSWKKDNLYTQPLFDNDSDGVADGEDAAGFKEAWWNYRAKLASVSGVFNPGQPYSLAYMTYVDTPDASFNQGPLFISAFDEALMVDRTLQLGTTASCFGMQLLVSTQEYETITRVISVNSYPGISRI